jgi:lysophospholipase L1-like esterase
MNKKTILFASITVLAFLLLSDFILRLALSPLPSKPFEWPPADMTAHGMMPDPHLFWKLRPGYDGPWGFFKLAYTHELVEEKKIDWQARKERVAPAYAGVTWEVNSHGFRGPTLSGKKNLGAVRLLFLGSSVTFGWGVGAEQAFPERVGRELEARHAGVSFESVNAGVPGYASFQGLRYLETLLYRYEPDLVVAEFGINDGTVAVGRSDRAWEHSRLNDLRLWLRHTGWARLILRVFPPQDKSAPVQDVTQTYQEARENFYRISMTGTRTRVSPADFKANLEKMAARCRNRGTRFFSLVPCLFNEYGKGELVPSVAFEGPVTLPACKTLSARGRDKVQALFLPFDEAHLSPQGHEVLARGLVEFLEDRVDFGKHAPSRGTQ